MVGVLQAVELVPPPILRANQGCAARIDVLTAGSAKNEFGPFKPNLGLLCSAFYPGIECKLFSSHPGLKFKK